MSLTEAVWPHFEILVFGGRINTPVWGMGGRRGSELLPQDTGRATLFARETVFFLHDVRIV